jgi:nitrogen fixation protein FixH
MEKVKDSSQFWWTFLKVFFSLVLVVNFYFLYLGINTNHQPIETAAYDKGQKYQEEIDQQNNFNKLFQKPKIKISDGILSVELVKLDRSTFSGAKVSAQLLYSANQNNDQNLTLLESANGVYQANLSTKTRGIWMLKLEVNINGQNLQYNQQVTN